MRAIIAYVVSVLMSFLPPRYRTTARLRGPTMVSAILQLIVGVFGLIFQLFAFAAGHAGNNQPGLPRGASERIVEKYGDAGLIVTSPFVLVDFWLHPINIVLIFLVLEGTLRLLSARAFYSEGGNCFSS